MNTKSSEGKAGRKEIQKKIHCKKMIDQYRSMCGLTGGGGGRQGAAGTDTGTRGLGDRLGVVLQ